VGIVTLLKKISRGLALAFILLVGCARQYYVTECDLNHYHDLGLPAGTECNPAASIVPSSTQEPAPPTTDRPERKIRYISLAEAIAIALEQGTTGSQALDGSTSDSLAVFSGGGVGTAENGIRILALDPAIIGTNIDASLAKFDAKWITSMTWQTTDQPTGGVISGSSIASGVSPNNESATFQSALLKPLPTGGVAGITFRTTYNFQEMAAPGTLNPTYRPSLQFQFEQPLLQGFGVEINQLRPTHPGSILTPFNVGGRVEGVIITRLRFDEQRAEFERQVHVLLANVEVAYWNLYGAYGSLYASEQGLRQAYEAWNINDQRFNIGRANLADLSQSRGQYELFRSQRLAALDQVLEVERQLRGLLRLPISDCTRLVPADAPTLAPYTPDWCTAVNEALALRPELIIARNDLKFRQLDLVNQKNLLMPDLRFTSTYDINGIGTHLDGGASDPNNAFHSLATDKFNDWSLGLNLNVPLGFRDAHSAVRQAHLNIARSYAVLRDQEVKAQRFVGQQYRLLSTNYQQIEIIRSERQADGLWVNARLREFLVGRGTLDFLLEAQRAWASDLSAEYQAIAAYNNTLVRFAFATGEIMDRDRVMISEGPLPECAQIRAVEHERQRSKALVLRERANIVPCPPKVYDGHNVVGLPELPQFEAPSVPSLLEGQKSLPPLPEKLPFPVAAPSSQLSAPPFSAPVHSTPSLPLTEPRRVTTQGAMPAPVPLPAGPQPAPLALPAGPLSSPVPESLPYPQLAPPPTPASPPVIQHTPGAPGVPSPDTVPPGPSLENGGPSACLGNWDPLHCKPVTDPTR
jgi:outer membrane protein TolC